MTGQSLAEVLLKISGVLFLTRSVISIPLLLRHVFGSGSQNVPWRVTYGWNFAQSFATAAAGVALLVLAPAIARTLVPEENEAPANISGPELSRVGFGVLGAYLLVSGLGDLVAGGLQLVIRKSLESPPLDYLWASAQQSLVEAVVLIPSGIALVLGRDGLARAWRHIRSMASFQDEDGTPGAV